MRKISSFMTEMKIHLALFILLAAGFVLRIYDLGAPSFWMDESISSIAAIALMEKGSPILPSGFMYSRELLNTFLIASSFKIFGITEYSARVPGVLFGTLMILLAYLMGSKWGNKRIGIMAALLVAFSVWEIAWSRQARMYQQLQFFYILSLYLFYEFINHRNLKNLVFLALSFLGAVISHVFGYVLIPVFLVYLIIITIKERSTMRNINQKVIVLTALVLGVLLSLSYYKGIIPSIMRTEVNYFDTYIDILVKDLGIFLFLAVTGGVVLMIKEWKKGILLGAGLIIPLYFIFFHVLLVATRYLYFVVPILFILAAYFLDLVNDRLDDRKMSGENTANIIVALLLVLTMYFSPAFTFIPKDRYDLGLYTPQPGFREAYLYVKDNMGQGDVIISTWTPPAQFYLGKSDYRLSFDVIGTGEEVFLLPNSKRDIYTNATVISDVGGLMRVVDENPAGWIIVDSATFPKLRYEITNYIKNNLTFHMVSGKIEPVEVYGWYHDVN
jgi:4-amino-4-deoxy-L-arabinose transferase-like glycosyltransferase